MDSVNLLVWLPTLMICIILILDGKNIVKQFSGWEDFVKKFIPTSPIPAACCSSSLPPATPLLSWAWATTWWPCWTR